MVDTLMPGRRDKEHVVGAIRDDERLLEAMLEALSERFLRQDEALGFVADRYLGLIKHQLFEV